MYLLLETLTFPSALAIDNFQIMPWTTETDAFLNVEGQRFWFLALCCGVALAFVRLARLWASAVEGEMGVNEAGKKRYKIVRRLVADCLDLAVPGAVVGWVPASPGTVGLLMLGSTWLTSLEVWEKCALEVRASKGKGK